MLPNWHSLVSTLLEIDVGTSKAEVIMPTLSAGFGLDALVQACRECLGISAEKFAQLLSEIYASDLCVRFMRQEAVKN
jgi:hypothetical protein